MEDIRAEIAHYREVSTITSEGPRRERMGAAVEATFVALSSPENPPVSNEVAAYENSASTLALAPFTDRLEACVYDSLDTYIDRISEVSWRAEAMLRVLSTPIEKPLGFTGAHALFYEEYVKASTEGAEDAIGNILTQQLTNLSAQLATCAYR